MLMKIPVWGCVDFTSDFYMNFSYKYNFWLYYITNLPGPVHRRKDIQKIIRRHVHAHHRCLVGRKVIHESSEYRKKGGAAIWDNATSRELVSPTPKKGKEKTNMHPQHRVRARAKDEWATRGGPTTTTKQSYRCSFLYYINSLIKSTFFSHINLDGNPKRSFNQIEMPSKSQGELWHNDIT